MNKTGILFRPKKYFRPSSIREAVDVLAECEQKACIIAGGTDVMVDRDPQTEVLVDITGLDLSYIKSDGQGVKIGATTTFSAIAESPILGDSPYDVLAEAARLMGTPLIRNVATIGGNICCAVPSADSVPALLSLDANLSIVGPAGERLLNLTDFFKDVREHCLAKGELLTEIQLPVLPAPTEAVFKKKGRVAAGDLAVVNLAVRLTMTSDNFCEDVRIALGAVAPTPLRAKKAEAMLQGQKLHDELIDNVAAQAAMEISPISDVRSSAEYRGFLSRVLVARALKEVAGKLSKESKY